MSIVSNIPEHFLIERNGPADKDNVMFYEDFCDRYMEDAIYEYISESCHASGDGSFKTDICEKMVKERAESLGIFITDFDTFDYDGYFYNWYKCTEKVR